MAVLNNAKGDALTALVGGNPIKVLLLNSSHVTNPDTQEFVSDVIANEVSGTGYTTGGVVVANTSVVVDDANDRADLIGDDPTFSTVTITDASFAAFYSNTDVNSTSKILCIQSIASTDKTAEDLVLTLVSGTILRMS